MGKQIQKQKHAFTYPVPAGTYEADSMIGLLWEVFKHRTWHLLTHGKWID